VDARSGDAAPEELAAFQRRYWAAWDGCDLEATAECIDEDFAGTFAGPAGAPLLEVDRAGVLELIRASFDRARGERAGWRRSGLLVLRRGSDEAAAAMRVDCLFPAHPEWSNAEITVESYRRRADGRWRICRVHSERLR
jgi:hypothetical protein